MGPMTRWQPDAANRLAQAALDLYAEHGFDATTSAAIAARAGVTERTFFRHHADKREVLFAGSTALQDTMVDAVANAPDATEPLQVLRASIKAAEPLFPPVAQARLRQSVIEAAPELVERELAKLESLSAGLAAALQSRGTGARAAETAARVAVALFKVAYDRWLDEKESINFSVLVDLSFEELAALVDG